MSMPEQKAKWEQGSVDDWAIEAYAIAKSDVYGSGECRKITCAEVG